jgi:hypothetical protein
MIFHSFYQFDSNYISSIEHQETSIDYDLSEYISENLPTILFFFDRQAGLSPIQFDLHGAHCPTRDYFC